MSIAGTSVLPGEPQMVGRVGCRARGRARRARLQHQVERLGADSPIGVEQHDRARR